MVIPESSVHAPRRVLGIDPGLRVTGYGVLDISGNAMTVVEAGVVRAESEGALESRLSAIYDGISEVIAEHQPEVAVVEELYSTYRHPRTAILMGHARGAIFLAADQGGVPVVSYGATEMKRAVTGNGRASKAQIQRTVQQRLGLRSAPSPSDVADALALAFCHAIRCCTDDPLECGGKAKRRHRFGEQ